MSTGSIRNKGSGEKFPPSYGKPPIDFAGWGIRFAEKVALAPGEDAQQ